MVVIDNRRINRSQIVVNVIRIEQPERRTREVLAAALGDDPMRLLAERRKKRQALIDPSKFEQAEKDRVLYSGVL